MYYVKKQLKSFSAAHRLIKGYVGKCRNLHGHNYKVAVTFAADKLDHYDFVIDFDDVNALCDNWVAEHWDHGVLISEADQSLIAFCQQDKQKYYLIPGNQNTTVECLSKHLFHRFEKLLADDSRQRFSHITITQVEVAESDTAKAIYSII